MVLERNWRLGHKELDVVCMKDDMLVVVEVKTRICPAENFGGVVECEKEEESPSGGRCFCKGERDSAGGPV